MRDRMQAWFQQVEDRGMRMIPFIAVGNRYCSYWKQANSLIKDNAWSDNGAPRSASPMAPEPEFDKTFTAYLGQLKIAWNGVTKRPGSSTSLPYFLLGLDEIFNPAVPYELLPARTSIADQQWISNKKWTVPGKTESWYYQALMSAHLLQRVKQIRTAFPNAQVLVYADMWDDQLNGSLPLKTRDGKTVTMAGAIDFPGLTPGEVAFLKSAILFVPWRYEVRWIGPNLSEDWMRAFKRFHDKGYRFLAGTSLYASGPNIEWSWADMVTAMRWLRAGELQDKAAGFIAQPYPAVPYAQNPGAAEWSTLETAARLGRSGRTTLFR
jgi:hypothetical protein